MKHLEELGREKATAAVLAVVTSGLVVSGQQPSQPVPPDQSLGNYAALLLILEGGKDGLLQGF